ncbi:MAG: dimethyl sulfoxide reductase anchor subunit [Anaerolineales bacterium]
MNVREWALPVYTILMQTATGSLSFLWLIRLQQSRHQGSDEASRLLDIPLTVILTTIIFAMIGSHFHLSRPFLSLLAVTNLRSSWLSREILFTILLFLLTLSIWVLHRVRPSSHRVIDILGWLGITSGWIMIYCMARIYLLPTQVAWNSPATILYYITTTLLLGSSALLAILWMDQHFVEVRDPDSSGLILTRHPQILARMGGVVLFAAVLEIALEFFRISWLHSGNVVARTSLDLLFGLYQPLLLMRIGLVLIGSIWLTYNIFQVVRDGTRYRIVLLPIYSSFLLLMIGEILGRFLFYATHVRIGL